MSRNDGDRQSISWRRTGISIVAHTSWMCMDLYLCISHKQSSCLVARSRSNVSGSTIKYSAYFSVY